MVKETLSRQLKLVHTLFKQQYDSHMQMENDNIDTHRIEYGLKKLRSENQKNAPIRYETCNSCHFKSQDIIKECPHGCL